MTIAASQPVLIGMFDSPFVRRVAVSMQLLNIAFEHRNWSVGRDFERIRELNPLGRVPTLLLEDGTVLIESGAILDYLDHRVGTERALLPATGAVRREALQIMAIASGAAEKAVLQIYEIVFRPADKRHEPWTTRCRLQMQAALAELERRAAARAGGGWLAGAHMTQADITVTCMFSFMDEALQLRDEPARYPALRALCDACEALSAFKAFRAPFNTPSPP